MSLSIEPDSQPEFIKIIHDLRRALIDSFLSIINGIKS
jgi:hypothetical protein